MTEENFFDMFNRIHNPDYYYGKQKTQEKKTKKKRAEPLLRMAANALSTLC